MWDDWTCAICIQGREILSNTMITHRLLSLTSDLPATEGDTGSIPGSGRSPGEGNDSSILAWEIPWTEEPSELWSMGSQRAGYNFDNYNIRFRPRENV